MFAKLLKVMATLNLQVKPASAAIKATFWTSVSKYLINFKKNINSFLLTRIYEAFLIHDYLKDEPK